MLERTIMITTTTTILKVNVSGIPKFLKEQPYWINWKPFFIDGKARKLPTCGNIALRAQYWDEAGRNVLRYYGKNPSGKSANRIGNDAEVKKIFIACGFKKNELDNVVIEQQILLLKCYSDKYDVISEKY